MDRGLRLAAVLAALSLGACGRGERDASWRMGPGVGGPKRPGGTVPRLFHEPPATPPVIVVEPCPDPCDWEGLRIFLESGRLPRLRHSDEKEPSGDDR